MERRDFIHVCAASALGLGTRPSFADADADAQPRQYARTRLTDESGQPLRAAQLVAGENYVFHYPFEGTPCFLINLVKPTTQNVALKTGDGASYQWPGGVGPQRAIVGYSAICSHQLTYPTRQISFISYREQSTASKISKPRMIHCCSEHSEYDPAAGTLGGEMFNTFFSKYEMRLTLEHGSPVRAHQRVAGTSAVTALTRFCKQQVRC